MKIKILSSLLLAVSLLSLSGCGDSSEAPDFAPKATLVGRYALNAGAGVSDLHA